MNNVLKQKLYKLSVSGIVLLIPLLMLATKVKAEEVTISVSGNGNNSSNEVSTQVQNNTTVTQSNNAEITNNVENNANTGNNEANSNTGGETSIDTGSVSTETTVTNQNINTNSAQLQGGNPAVNAEISGNGSHSSNTINSSVSNNITTTQYNSATITNNITTNANTGYNTASYNNGNVEITTGNITSKTMVNNKNINNAIALAILGGCNGECEGGNFFLKISGNGDGSVNTINFDHENNVVTYVENIIHLYNNIWEDLNTGHNTANNNLGDVEINTGDIKSEIVVNNKDINSSFVKVDCCQEKEEEPEKPEEPKEPETPTGPSNGGNGGGGNGGVGGAAGQVHGASVGEILPITGNYLIYLLTLASLIMFFMGWYLRFRSGCAPGRLAYAF